MKRSFVFVQVVFGLFIYSTVSAYASSETKNTDQHNRSNREKCEHSKTPPEVLVKSCTALIKLTKLAPRELAITYMKRGLAFFSLKKNDSAINDLNKAIQVYSHDPVIFYDRGRIYHLLDRFELAIQDYSRAIELDTTFIQAYANRAVAFLDVKKYAQALKDSNIVLKIRPENANDHTNRGNIYLKLKQYDKAIRDYDQAIKLSPNDAIHYNNRGAVHRALKEYDLAIPYFDKAISLNSKDEIAYYNRGIIYARMGKCEKSVADLSQGVRLSPATFRNYLIRAFCLTALERYELAIQDLGKVLNLKPNLGPVYGRRARLYFKLGQNGKAFDDLWDAVEISSRNYLTMIDYAWFVATSKKHVERPAINPNALEASDRALKLKDTFRSRAARAAALANLGRFKEAVQEQERAIEKLLPTDNASLIQDHRRYLTLYRNQKPLRLDHYFKDRSAWEKLGFERD